MSNPYGISEKDEPQIRARDKICVYCRILMKHYPHAMGALGATIEHFNNNGPFEKKYNVAICCRRCNSSKGTKRHPLGSKRLNAAKRKKMKKRFQNQSRNICDWKSLLNRPPMGVVGTMSHLIA